ncbi:MAG: sporulation protein YtfJ [Clostridiales bacterium]|nr:sporulation protein YtfJ [Clostridiales bacterium]
MHPIENILQTTMSELRHMIDVNTIVGEAILTPSGTTIIPISKVSFGFVSGGGEFEKKNNTSENALPMAGGSASGITINPVAFLVSEKSNLRLMCANSRTTVDKLIDMAPQLLSEIRNFFEKDDETFPE